MASALPFERDGFAGYAGLGERLLANLIDCAAIGLTASTARAIFQRVTTGEFPPFAIHIEFAELNVETALYLVYWIAFLCSDWSATPGKKLVRLKVVDPIGDGLPLWRAAIRTLIEMVSLVLLPLSALMILLDRRKRAPHDWIAGSFVIRNLPQRRPRGTNDTGDMPPPVPVGSTTAR